MGKKLADALSFPPRRVFIENFRVSGSVSEQRAAPVPRA
jgi:hypothetical protein